jgi:hypothetical protein
VLARSLDRTRATPCARRVAYEPHEREREQHERTRGRNVVRFIARRSRSRVRAATAWIARFREHALGPCVAGQLEPKSSKAACSPSPARRMR